MNPVYTGKDVSFIDTKQAQRAAENTLLAAEKFGSLAMLLGARFPAQAIDKAWRQLLFGAHHDGITGSESDQVYLDLLGGWREALELGKASLDGALGYLAARVDTAGEGRPVVVFNPMSWPRTDVARVVVELTDGATGHRATRRVRVRSALRRGSRGAQSRSCAGTGKDRLPGARRACPRLPDVPSAVEPEAAGRDVVASHRWRCHRERGLPAGGRQRLRRHDPEPVQTRAPARNSSGPGASPTRSSPTASTRTIRSSGEGPWHLTPSGTWSSSSEHPAKVVFEDSAIGQRAIVEGEIEGCSLRQEIVFWDRVDRVDFTTRLDEFAGHDRLFRVRFPIDVEGGRPVSEVGNAVIARPFGFPNVDVGEAPFTLDNPAYNLVRPWRHRARRAEGDRVAGRAASGDGHRRRGGHRGR